MRACSFSQCRTPGHEGLHNRQSLRTDSHWSGTLPCSHRLAEMWSDLTMVWRSPAQSHSALFLPTSAPDTSFVLPLHPSNSPILRILFQVPSVALPSLLEFSAFSLPCALGFLQMDYTALPVLFTASLSNTWVSKRPYDHYPQSN